MGLERSQNSIPTSAQLRQAAEALFVRGEWTEPYTAILSRQSAALLRAVAEQRDPRLLAAALKSGVFTPEHTAQVLRASPHLPYGVRLLLQHPELAEDLAGKDAAPPPEAGAAEEQLRRWQFEAGVSFPFLRRTVLAMERCSDPVIAPFGTDGFSLYFRPDAAEIRFEDFQHMLLHCLFRHMVPPENALRPLWDLSCDVSCEYLRAELFPSPDGRENQLLIADALPSGCDPRSAAAVYRGLMEIFEDELEGLRRRFPRDDHRYWYESPRNTAALPPGGGSGEGGGVSAENRDQALEATWKALAEQLPQSRRPSRRYGLAPGSREEKALLRQAGKYDFTRYLRRFSTLREEMQLDESSFDYIPYHYGLERYGNLPFLEPLETTESYKIEELVIAIDTSGSCSRETVERFLGEIQRILMQRENFFKKMDIHIMQCDAILQDDTEIRSLEEWKRYLTDLRIRGRGGTNFNPVFDRVEKLQKQGKLKRLRGLLYFTDGDGVYPRKKPPYETAFVFTDRSALERKLPEWIVPLCLDNCD